MKPSNLKSWLLGASAAASLAALPAAADDHPGWREAFDGKGEYGYLSTWFVGNHKIAGEDGVVGSKYFKEAILGTQKLPLELIQAGLDVPDKAKSLYSTACLGNWSCKFVTPSFEMLVLRRDPAHKAIIEGFFAKDSNWQQAGYSWRGFLIRMVGWYNDKSLAPLVVKMATFEPDSEYTNDALTSAASLLGTWNDKSLIEPCQAAFEVERNDARAIEPARQACAWYLTRMGDKAVGGKLKRARMGSDYVATLAAAAMGNTDAKADWQKAAKEFAGSPDRTDHAVALVALALSGDGKAEKQVVGLLGGKNPDAAWEHATLLANYADTPVGKRVLAAVKKAVYALPTKEKAGRVQAVVAAHLARMGDAGAVPAIKKLFASDDESVREYLARTLATGTAGVVLKLPGNGLAGGASAAGLVAVLQEAFGNEGNKAIRANIARAWAMAAPAGGS